jgi:outer membrane protein OmpA-like peptidoglycan-associated protein
MECRPTARRATPRGAALLAACAGLAFAAAAPAAQSVDIPRVNGLTFTEAQHEERGDIESITTLSKVTATQYLVVVTADIPNAADPAHPKRLRIERTIRIVDDSSAHRINGVMATDDPPIFPNSTLANLSTAMFTELMATGKTPVVYAAVPANAYTGLLAMVGASRKYYRGDLVRGARSTVGVIVNGVPTQLPVIEVRGHLTVAQDTHDVDLFVLDNARWPIVLKASSAGREGQITEIAWPSPEEPGATSALAKAMTKTCRAELRGIYFGFASAELVAESDLALKQAAQLLAANPSWSVTIEGYTDNIGTSKANLELSRRRAEAVRNALVTRFNVAPARLSVAGFGDAHPVASNATLDGRARNRRVELARKC